MIPSAAARRELIIGDRGVGKTTIAIDTILNQKSEDKKTRLFVFTSPSARRSRRPRRLSPTSPSARRWNTHRRYGASVIPCGASSSSLPFAGAAIGEHFMEQGKDALVVYDDLSKQAVAYRQLSLLLRPSAGPRSISGATSSTCTRASLNALQSSPRSSARVPPPRFPIIETQEGDVSAYIPTNVISITDGQIFLLTDLFNKGARPAIDVGISVSRVGSSAQTKAMKKVSGKIKLELAQFRETRGVHAIRF